MNRLAFDPHKQKIQEWQEIYFCQEIIDSFQTIIDKTHMYLEVISNHKTKQTKGKGRLKSKRSLCSETDQVDVDAIRSEIKYFQSDDPQTSIQRIQEWINSVRELTNQANSENEANRKDQQADNAQDDPLRRLGLNVNKVLSIFKFKLCQIHLESITVSAFKYYNAILHQEFKIIKEFLYMKFIQLQDKMTKLELYFGRFNSQSEHYDKLRILYENVFIEADYLKKFIYKNKEIFQHYSHEKQYSSGYEQINEIREKFIDQLSKLCTRIDSFKQKIRIMYWTQIRKSNKRIRNHDKLQEKIRCQIAVNSDQYKNTSSATTFVNGFTFAFLLCMLVAIIIFRQVNINALEADPNYLSDFKVWRGASFLIYYNWIFGIVFWFFNKFRINYRLILLEEDKCIPSHQTFFLSASLLSAIYLVLFFVYLLYQLKIIVGYDGIRNMGFYMWIVNLVFLFNPFKILNYEGRRYFITLFLKNIMTLLRPMNMNIFFLAIIIGSFVQPFSDFAFTVCRAAYLQDRDCIQDTKIATFTFTMTYLFYRFVQSIRSHMQFGDRCYSRPLIGITAVSFGMNTVISSFLYNIYLTDQLRTYWIISAIFSTIAGIQADLRADWGLISFDKEDWVLRKYKLFPRTTYFIVSAIDIVLNIGWVLTLSNSTADEVGINPVYFLMILAYIQLARKGMWMFFRIQDDHSLNIANLTAILDDSYIYKTFDGLIGGGNSKSASFQLIVFQRSEQQVEKKYIDSDPQGNDTILQSGEKYYDVLKSNGKMERSSENQSKEPPNLQKIQLMVINRKLIRAELKLLINQLEVYLNTVHTIYSNLDWEDEE